MWRKNRQVNTNSSCKGVDLNRNFGYHWGESGVSFNPCSDIFCGTGAYSSLETQNIKAYVEKLEPVPTLGNVMHSYSQLWLWPYGYASEAFPDNWEENVRIKL